MTRAFDVLVRLLDRDGNSQAERCVRVNSIDPGHACQSAFVLVRQEMNAPGATKPKTAALSFLVRVGKERQI